MEEGPTRPVIGIAQVLAKEEVAATRLMPRMPHSPILSTEATLRELQIRWMDAWRLGDRSGAFFETLLATPAPNAQLVPSDS